MVDWDFRQRCLSDLCQFGSVTPFFHHLSHHSPLSQPPRGRTLITTPLPADRTAAILSLLEFVSQMRTLGSTLTQAGLISLAILTRPVLLVTVSVTVFGVTPRWGLTVITKW